MDSRRFRTLSTDGRSAAFRRRDDNFDLDGDGGTDDLVYVANVADTNLLLVVVDGHQTAATTTGTSHRQVTQSVISLRNRLPSSAVIAETILQFKTSLKAIDFSYALLGKN